MKCPVCEKGTRSKVDDILYELEGNNLIISGERCNHCGEEYIDEQELQRIAAIGRKLGIWGKPFKLHRKLSKSGRGTVLRIPTDIEKNLKLKGNEEVAISKVGDKKILIEIENGHA
ncbi:YgiT-type zinc finger protein [Candidatus Woesearchaeota archaeon]|nr:YgiT-type zinc finger protein [Candidatus Woesearchaeota archaeon]